MAQLRALGPLAVILLCASCGGVTERRGGDKDPTVEPVCELETDFGDSAVGLQTPPFGREHVCGLRGWYLPSDGHWVCTP